MRLITKSEVRMTTKIQHRSIDLLTTRAPLSLIYHYHSGLDFGSRKSEFSMNRMLELQTIESMRKMMLIQEDIFKQQVQDLHRLYNLQKKLMREIETGLIKREKAKTDTNTINSMFSGWHQTGTKTGQSNLRALIDLKEVSGSCSGDNNSSRMPIKLGLSTPDESTSNNIDRLSEDRKDLKRIDEENDVEVELTLSIGHVARNKRLKNEFDESNQVNELGSSSSVNDNSSTVSVSQENMKPHWLLQDLSLNRT
ncbi:hypothetical protein CASFOL_013871 [Castilleja foliolosa]|uniref:MYB-CC type transcription factor LHEQLE-containing domain-containing protein n=1 Tax=Castilleja foliolosa TaxID=1961234 RepID=A0ABD3DL98_9LAMI